MTSIGDWAFSECTNLTSVTIGNSLTSIGSNAFSWCTSLTSITIPNSVTSIGSSAFAECISLTSITIPNSVKSIRNSAFEECTGLRDIYTKNSTPPTCEKDVFSGVRTVNCRLHVPSGSKENYAFADGWCDFYNIIEDDGEESIDYKTAYNELLKEVEKLRQGDLNKDGKTDINDVAYLLALTSYCSDSDALANLTEGTNITTTEIAEKYGSVEYYTLDGTKVSQPTQSGIYLVKMNGETKMIVVKK